MNKYIILSLIHWFNSLFIYLCVCLVSKMVSYFCSFKLRNSVTVYTHTHTLSLSLPVYLSVTLCIYNSLSFSPLATLPPLSFSPYFENHPRPVCLLLKIPSTPASQKGAPHAGLTRRRVGWSIDEALTGSLERNKGR